MKRKIFAVIAAFCAFSLAACAGGKSEASGSTAEAASESDSSEVQNGGTSSESAEESSQQNGESAGNTELENPEAEDPANEILMKVAEANTREALMTNNERVACINNYYLADGTQSSSYCYQDAEIYAYENSEEVLIDDGELVYGFYNNLKVPFAAQMIDMTHDEFIQYFEPLVEYNYDETEEVISQDESGDGTITVSTVLPAEGIMLDVVSAYGFEPESEDYIECLYKIDADSFELLSCSSTLCRSDGTKTLYNEMTRVEEPEIYVPDEQISKQIFSDDTRTVTLTVDPGTENETVYEKTVGKGCGVSFYFFGSMQIYTDRECTQPMTSMDVISDSVLYAVTATEE